MPQGSGRRRFGSGCTTLGSGPTDPKGEAALKKYLAEKDDLLAGRTPRPKAEGITVADLCNHFLTSKRHLAQTGEISTRTFADYYAVAQNLVKAFGKDRLVLDLVADDFDRLRRHVARTRGPVGIGNEVQRVRTIFRYGHEAGLYRPARPVRPDVQEARSKVLRLERAKRGSKMLEAADIRRILDAAPMPLKAMVLLGVNCGFGNSATSGRCLWPPWTSTTDGYAFRDRRRASTAVALSGPKP